MTSISASISGSPVFSETLRYASALKETSAERFDGNISEIRVIHNGVSDDTYAYQYDALKRLTGANRYIGTATTYSDTRTEKYMSYDRNGNLTALKRYGDTGLENNLTFTRSGNRMTGLSDAVSPGGSFSFTYDVLGNMTNDGRKGLVISYNVLNLPSGVVTTASGSLTYTYLSDGTKVSAIKSDGSGERYIGSFVYSVPASGSETLESAAWDEGRINFTKSGSTYTKTDLWFVKDHVGNVRTVMNVTTSLSSPQVLERNDYLPFGTRMDAGTAVLTTNRFRLGGKENQTFGSLDLGKVDFGARLYDPFTAGYCGGNPVGILDNGGLDLVIAGKNGSSIAIKTDLINASVSVEKFGIDWGGNYAFEGYDYLTAALDIAGFVDQSGTSDFINAGVHWGNGNFWGGLASAVGIVPLVGDFAKAGRIGKEVKLFSDAISAGHRFEKHHIIPIAVYKKYESALKDILPLDDPKNLMGLSAEIGGKAKKFHANHPAYSNYIESQLDVLKKKNMLTKENVEAVIDNAKAEISKAGIEHTKHGTSLNDYFK